MSVNRGRNLYVPFEVLEELDNLNRRRSVKERKPNKKYRDAWDTLIFYTKVGKNVDDVYAGIFGRRNR